MNNNSIEKQHHPSIIAVVLTHNESDDTINCVHSLLANNYPELNIIIVDNASHDGTPDKIKKVFPEIQIIVRQTNGGYPAGNNTGIRKAIEQRPDYILISNSDVIIEKGTLTSLVATAEQDKNIGVVAPTVRYTSHPDQLYYAAGKFSPWFCSAIGVTSRAEQLIADQQEADVTFVNGALLLFRREVFETLGLIEEKFFLYHDDLEFSRRYGKRYRLVYTPRATVFHKSGAGKSLRSYTVNYLYYHTRNRFWVFEEEPIWYRCYVAIVTMILTVSKTMYLALNFITDPGKATKQLSALWRGFRDGLFTTKRI